MITITYDPQHLCGNAIPDGEIDQFADEIQKQSEKNKDLEYHVPNFLLIQELRARIVEKKIDWTKIQFKFNDQIIPHNKEARFEFWPKGFGDQTENILRRLLVGINERYNKKR